MKQLFLILIACCLSIISVNAQQHYFRHYQVEDGLSNNTAICTLQDKNGFLWFGTKDGLNRFDGYTFKVFRNDPDDSTSIGHNSIWRIHEDAKGTIWVGTERGVYSYNPLSENFKLLPGSPRNEIAGITTGREGELWFIAGYKLYNYSFSTNKLISFASEKGLEFCTAICKSIAGDIWIATLQGNIVHYNNASGTFSHYSVFNHSRQPAATWIEKIYDSGKNFLFIGTSNQGIKKFNLSDKTYTDLLIYNDDNTEIFARDFIHYDTNEYWFATESGIYIYNDLTNTFINLKKDLTDPYALSDNAVYSFTKDKEGGIWAGTYFGGINYYPSQKLAFEKYFFSPGKNSLQGNAVREIKKDNNGNMWIGTEDAGLNKYNPHTGIFTNYKPKNGNGNIAHSNIHGLLLDNNKLWIGTFEHGLDVMDLATEKITQHFSAGPQADHLKSNFIYTFFKNSKGDILVGTSNGLHVYQRDKENFTQLNYFPDNTFFSTITEDENNTLWIGTFNHGLFFLNPEKKTSGNLRILYKGKDKLSSNRVTNLYFDSRKLLWVCTENGLFRVNTDTKLVKEYSIKNGLPGNLIYSIIEDNQSNFWITTSKGLARLNDSSGTVNIFTKASGLLSDQFNYSSSYKDDNGHIYLGCVKGMISFNPQEYSNSTYIPPVFITNFQVSNKDVNIGTNSILSQSLQHTKKIELKHFQSTFSIDFAALNFSSPENVEYAYKLEGLDKDWNFIKTNRRVYFTNLSPGNYKFLVKSTNGGGKWLSNQKEFSIDILPPWWKTNLAYLLYSLAAIVAAWQIILFFHKRQIEKQKRRMELFKIAKEREVYESKIDFFTKIAHEIKTPLTLIKAPMEKLIGNVKQTPQIEKHLLVMNKNTERLLELTSQLLDFRKIESEQFSLQLENINISEAVKNICANFQPLAESKNINLLCDAPYDLYCNADEEAITKMVSNLLDNAIKYGHTKAVVAIQKNGMNTLHISISNDGPLIPGELHEKIFEPFFRSKHTDKITGTGIGLSLARSLAELHSGSIRLSCTEKLNTFIIEIPL